MRVIVTGGSGFLGSRVLTLMRERGHDAVGLDVRPGPGVLPADLTGQGWQHELDGAAVWLRAEGVLPA